MTTNHPHPAGIAIDRRAGDRRSADRRSSDRRTLLRQKAALKGWVVLGVGLIATIILAFLTFHGF